jgi:hypothetical protein
MDPYRKITKKFIKKFGSKVINRQYFQDWALICRDRILSGFYRTAKAKVLVKKRMIPKSCHGIIQGIIQKCYVIIDTIIDMKIRHIESVVCSILW